MAKRKRRPGKPGFMARILPRNKEAEDARLSHLAQELGIAAMTVLVNDYGFSREQANEFLSKMLAQAQETRQMLNAQTVLAAYEMAKEQAGRD